MHLRMIKTQERYFYGWWGLVHGFCQKPTSSYDVTLENATGAIASDKEGWKWWRRWKKEKNSHFRASCASTSSTPCMFSSRGSLTASQIMYFISLSRCTSLSPSWLIFTWKGLAIFLIATLTSPPFSLRLSVSVAEHTWRLTSLWCCSSWWGQSSWSWQWWWSWKSSWW